MECTLTRYFCAAGATLRTAKPRRSAEGARLDGFLAESEGPIRDPDLSNFAKDYAFPSAESGSGQPPDRAQICSFDDDDVEAGLKLFFSEPVSGPPKVNLRHRNGKMNVKKSGSHPY